MNNKKIEDVKRGFSVRLLMHFFGLKYVRNKVYSAFECDPCGAYVFSDTMEFKNYFVSNGCDNISDDELNSCKFITTKKGFIIALKNYCDYIIDKYKKDRIINYYGFTDVDKYIKFFGLVEEPNKEYSTGECAGNIVYVFNGIDKLRKYFVDNGIYNISDDELMLCKFFAFDNGLVIASKVICDQMITNYKNIISNVYGVKTKSKVKQYD